MDKFQRAPGIGDGCVLRGDGLRQRVQSREPVFHLLERDQHRLAIVRPRFVVSRFRRRQIGAVAASLKNRLQQIATHRPDRARPGEQVGDVGALDSAAAEEGELRIERRRRNSYLRVLVSHLALGGGDIRTPLQQIGRHAQRNRRRSCIQRRRRNAEGRGRISGEHRDGVFKLRALLLHQVKLRLGGIEQRLLLRQVKSRGHSARMPRIHQFQTFFLDRQPLPGRLAFPRRARAG